MVYVYWQLMVSEVAGHYAVSYWFNRIIWLDEFALQQHFVNLVAPDFFSGNRPAFHEMFDCLQHIHFSYGLFVVFIHITPGTARLF